MLLAPSSTGSVTTYQSPSARCATRGEGATTRHPAADDDDDPTDAELPTDPTAADAQLATSESIQGGGEDDGQPGRAAGWRRYCIRLYQHFSDK
jgi:hypothetical protein